MSCNLAELAAEEKNRIELDKQAAFLVWKLKHGKTVPEEIAQYVRSIRMSDEQIWFQQCVEKYKKVMGVM